LTKILSEIDIYGNFLDIFGKNLRKTANFGKFEFCNSGRSAAFRKI
jgi:hypothetical protein